MQYHIIAFMLGFFLDLQLGDPHWLWHPVRLIGKLIEKLEKKYNRPGTRGNFLRGIFTVIIVCFFSTVAAFVLTFTAYKINFYAGIAVEAVLTYYVLAAKCLKKESMKVYMALKHGTLENARKAVSMIVGRDTENLTEEEVCRAAVETVAENTSDGVIAPLLFAAIFGPAGGFFYKAVNTMDSMIGYKNSRYEAFGKAAAKLDDFVNFLPARLSAFLMIFSCRILGKDFSEKNALKIFRRDRYNHASPNSAQTESVCAGALGVRLAGPASYEGIIEEKPYIGDSLREIQVEDIKRVNRLMYTTAFLCFDICVLCLTLYAFLTRWF